MRPGAPSRSSSHPHGRPRRRSAPGEAASAASAPAPAPAGADSADDENEVMADVLDDGEDGMLGEEDPEEHEDGEEDGEHDGYDDYDDYENYDDDDDDDDDDQEAADPEGTLYHGAHHSCPVHHHLLPFQHPYGQSTDGYFSDDQDVSDDDAGAPLVDVFDPLVSSLLTSNNMGMHSDSVHSDSDPEDTEDGMLGHHPQPTSAAFADAAADDAVPPPVPNPPALPPFFHQLPAGGTVGHAFSLWLESFHPLPFSNPNPNTIGPPNYGLTDFLHHWARQTRILQGLARGRCPWPDKIDALESSQVKRIRYVDLEGDRCDFQGVNWVDVGVTRRDARERRLLTYNNFVSITGSDRWTPNLPDIALPCNQSFFRFRCMDIKRHVHLSHFQLRNVLASTSRSRVFYPTASSVQQLNTISGQDREVVRLADTLSSQISTMDAGHGVLVAGGFNGEYILRHLDTGEPEQAACHEGYINHASGITNHVAIQQARTSSAPLAAFASNDRIFRVMDIATRSWLSQEEFDYALNCTALSPDRRLRVMVGDSREVLITAAEPTLPEGQPDVLHRLSGHRDYGFACDWADDGWTIATAFQDKTVKIWDARRFTDSSGNPVSVCTIRSEMAAVRSLRFSPIGSGRRVLVAAEEADFVNVIDAQTFRAKQTIDLFGELGGIAFANGGQDLMVLCCDRTRGGVVQLERCGAADDESLWDSDEEQWRWRREYGQRGSGSVAGGRRSNNANTHDWPRSIFTDERRLRESASRRRRRVAAQVELEPF